jgi:A/G-specific adenine glycosylase
MPLRSRPPDHARPAPPDPARVALLLLRHFRRQARDLPWRRTTDPYAVWVSEIMLQQTQVATVIPYFERWMAELPDLESVARAPVEHLLRLWAGLGYYARPRRLQTAARDLLERFPGRWPQTPNEWKSLSGVGDYTAGAICSIAFNQPAAVVDGNVSRVLSRLWGFRTPPVSAQRRQRLWQLARELVAAAARLPARGNRNCADFNQALMELGAVHCTPRQPRCLECPLARLCTAHQLGQPERFPAPTTKRPTSLRHLRVWLLQRRGRYYVRPEPSHGWNHGLWQFPTDQLDPAPATPSPSATQESTLARLLFRISHAISRYRFRVEVCEVLGPGFRHLSQGAGRWLPLSELRDFPLSGLHRKIVARLSPRAAPAPNLTPSR